MEIRAKHVGRKRIDPAKYVEIEGAELLGADFSRRKLNQFASIGSRFERCQFDGIQVRDACFGEGRRTSLYIECSFDGARFTARPRGNARFERCSFRRVDIREWFCFEVEMIDCVFTGELRKAVFNGTVPPEVAKRINRNHNEFRGNDFSRAKLIDVAFRTGIDLTVQRMPTGDEYLYLPAARAAIAAARREVITWTNLELRREALSLIRTLEFETEGGQEQLFLRPATLSAPSSRDVDQVVFDLLRGATMC